MTTAVTSTWSTRVAPNGEPASAGAGEPPGAERPTGAAPTVPEGLTGEPGVPVSTTSTVSPADTPSAGSWLPFMATPTMASPGGTREPAETSIGVTSSPGTSATLARRPTTVAASAGGTAIRCPDTAMRTTVRSAAVMVAPKAT